MSRLLVVPGQFTMTSFAEMLRWLADHVDQDAPTTYTDDNVYGASVRLREALERKQQAADHIRRGR